MLFTRKRQKPGLEWGVRDSLTAYVDGLPDGVIAVDGIADIVPKTHPPRFWFPLIEMSGDEVRFAGTAQITGHGGLLRVTVRDPRLHFDQSRVVLSVASDLRDERLFVAVVERGQLDPHGWHDEAAHLTADGAAWLGPNYSAGDAVSPITYRPTSPSALTPKGV
ncbi:HtaA domain-containing protein [Pseudolysinimonas sp.]|jgi:hypothetical protein|uniref:HtaA domain-containing protein n=1 Tax=Pseudolysinimonas sp. TaxID=2680009 RepID=UPI0037832225